MIFRPQNKTYYLYADMLGRYWQLTPVLNDRIMMPFIVKPLTKKEFDELSR